MSNKNNLFPMANSVGAVGLTPDPEGTLPPHFNELPAFQIPLELPEFNPGAGLFQRCNLRLPQGCYRISMVNTLAFPFRARQDFDGTMRVENTTDVNGNASFAISGDFYRRRRNPFQFPHLPVNPLLHGAQVIPIFPRSRYHSYLKVVRVSKPTHFRLGQQCKITLTVEEYRYTAPATDADHGNFPETPTRTLRIELLSVPAHVGHTGPCFEGSVFFGAVRLPVAFRMDFVSRFFRKASLEMENVVGSAIPAVAGANDFKSIYATVGWDLDVVNGDIDLPVPAGVGASWSNAELHAFMLANRNPAVNLDSRWRYYYVSVPNTSDVGPIFGIMFDQLGDHREGSCNFINNMTGNFADAFSKLRSAAHEVGHGFNQLHPQNEDPALSSENFIMTQSGDTRSAIINAGGTYPDDIRFEFSPHHKHHFIHAPDVVVRPGGEDFGYGHHGAGFNPEDAEDAAAIGLQLSMDTVRNHIKLGEPLVLKIALSNNGNGPVKVPESIAWTSMHTNISVGQMGSDMREVSSFAHVCDSSSHQILDAGKTIKTEERIFWDTRGFVFTQPGVHMVQVAMNWDADGIPMMLSVEKYVWVDFPVTAAENAAAAQLMHPEVGKYLALGGNAQHLKTAVKRIADATAVAKDHPACEVFATMDNAKKKSKNK